MAKAWRSLLNAFMGTLPDSPLRADLPKCCSQSMHVTAVVGMNLPTIRHSVAGLTCRRLERLRRVTSHGRERDHRVNVWRTHDAHTTASPQHSHRLDEQHFTEPDDDIISTTICLIDMKLLLARSGRM